MTNTNEPPTLGEFNGFEIYPMPMFATLAVGDVAAVARWYGEALGFGTMFAGPPIGDQPSMVHLRRDKYQDVLLVPSRAAVAATAPATLTLSFSAHEVDELAARARSVTPVGASAVTGPVDTPWNSRDLRITDPAGHQLVFTSRQANPDPEQVKRMQAMFEAARKK
ncbi:MAG TPA: VOC family protein [Vicinamibacterales bacterium]|nr:VOC family protein [Vicinamibacterales bacterium]